ncbi:hypothetical protein CSW53_27295 (plasmid) [Rhodococcus ruber]|nr:hypothetical protein CSW53_27295 [Rhodococcus ruber]
MALSVRAVAPSRVVLVCSEQTRVEAGRVEDLIGPSGVRVDIVVCGAGLDFAETYQRLWDGLSDLGVTASFLLDYTGGTAAMVAVAVAIHQRIHLAAGGDRPDLRFYQDESAGVLVCDLGFRFTLDVALTVAEMARVHGFGINTVRRSPSPAVSWGADPLWRRAFLDRSDQYEKVAASTVELRQALEPLFETYADTGCERRSDSSSVWVDDKSGRTRAGKSMELAVLAVVLGEAWDEVVFSCEVQYPEKSSAAAVTEFDVVVRRGHQVVVLEVKSSLHHVAESAGKRLAAARTVFGGATRVLSVSPQAKRDVDPDDVGGLEDLGGQWEPALAALGRWRRHVLTSARDQAVEDLAQVGAAAAEFLPPPSAARGFSWPPAPPSAVLGDPIPEPSGARSEIIPDEVRARALVAAVGGSPLAVDNALAVTTAATTLLGTRDVIRAYRPHLASRGGAEPVVHRIDGLDARSIGSECGRLAPATLAITPSTKAATAGMTAAAGQAGHDLLHVDIAGGWAVSWRHGRWPHRHRVRWESVSNPQYDTDVDETWWTRLEQAGHTNVVALQALLRKIDLPDGAEVRFSPMPEVPWLVPILVTGSWRALGVAVPADVGKADRSTVLACDQHVASAVGDVGRLLVALPLHAKQDPAKVRTRWSTLLRRAPGPLFAFWRSQLPDMILFEKGEVHRWLG